MSPIRCCRRGCVFCPVAGAKAADAEQNGPRVELPTRESAEESGAKSGECVGSCDR